MKTFYSLLESQGGFQNFEFWNAFQMIRSEVMSIENKLQAGHDPRAVLERTLEMIKSHLQELEYRS